MAIAAQKDLHTDLVVIGAGGAGLTAAAAALESGTRDILILEKAAKPGGNTAQSAGMFAVDSPAQKRKGIQVSADEVFREKMDYANWRVDPGLARACVAKSGEIVEWLERKGMFFDSVIEFLREGQAPRVFHLFSPGPAGFIGQRIVDVLTEECLRQGVRVLYEAAATRLLADATGRIAGVAARVGDQDIRIEAKSVVLATGGFGASRELLDRYHPGHADTFTKGYPEMTGDGLVMAEEIGAVIDDHAVLLVTGPHHYPWSHVLTLLVRRPDILLVNKHGERYCPETLFLDYHTEAGNALSRQPGKICYGLLDSVIKDDMIRRREIVSGMEREAGGDGAWLDELHGELQANVATGTVKKADTWDELARHIGADPAMLGGAVARYNAYCHDGHDAEFLKEKRFLLHLETPPFYAVLGRQGFDTTLGGIKIDQRMQVIGRGGTPIPGLYAAGDCASGWEHTDYNLRHPGSALTFALCSGYVAGQQAALSMQGTG
jgi:succinate dehydrogenase/fumarate reductase flavoprotein subunit